MKITNLWKHQLGFWSKNPKTYLVLILDNWQLIQWVPVHLSGGLVKSYAKVATYGNSHLPDKSFALRQPRFWNKVFGHWRQSYCWWFRNPANSPVEGGSLSHYLQGFAGFLPSTVCLMNGWDVHWAPCGQGTLPAVTESFNAVVKRPDKTPRSMTSPTYTNFPNYFLVIYHLMQGTTIYFVVNLSPNCISSRVEVFFLFFWQFLVI